jgi:hypothetical protein
MNQTAQRFSGTVDYPIQIRPFGFTERREHIINGSDAFGRTTYAEPDTTKRYGP